MNLEPDDTEEKQCQACSNIVDVDVDCQCCYECGGELVSLKELIYKPRNEK